MKSDRNHKILSGALEVTAAGCYFGSLAVLIILWQSERWAWGFLVHLLVNASLVASLFAMRLSGYHPRGPFSLPGILLIITFIYGMVNAFVAPVAFAAVEWIPFLLDGLILFYLGTTLFARRYEGMTLLFILFVAGMILVSIHLKQVDLWQAEGAPTSFYRGKRMLLVTLTDHPWFGCGSGCLSRLSFHYLPLAGRYPPRFSSGLGIRLAEWGVVGALVWISFLISLFLGMFKVRRDKPIKTSLSKMLCFSMMIFMLSGLFVLGCFTLVFTKPAGLFLFLPLAGMAYGLRRGTHKLQSNSKGHAFSHLSFLVLVLILFFIVTFMESTPFLADRLSKISNLGDLGTRSYGRRIDLAAFLMPYYPEIHLNRAKHLRSLHSEESKGVVFRIEGAYLSAIGLNRYKERNYLEYAHFLDLVKDYGSMVSILEQGAGYCPGSVDIKMLLASGYLKTGKRKECLDLLNTLKRVYPIDYATHRRVGKLYSELGSLRAAREADLHAMQTMPAFR